MPQNATAQSPIDTRFANIKTHNIGNPAAGSEAIWIAPNNWRARLLAVTYTATIAQPAAAYPEIRLGTSGPTILHTHANQLLANLSTWTIHFSILPTITQPIAANDVLFAPLPPEYYYEDGYSLRIRVTNIANATQLSNISFTAAEWILA